MSLEYGVLSLTGSSYPWSPMRMTLTPPGRRGSEGPEDTIVEDATREELEAAADRMFEILPKPAATVDE